MKSEGRVEVCWTRVWGAQGNNMYKAAGKNVDVYEKREIKTGSPLHNAILQEGVLIV